MRKRVLLWIMVMILIYSFSMTVCAQNIPDLTQKGSLEITMKRHDIVVPGGNFILYHVGIIEEQDGKYTFQLLEEWVPSGANLQNMHSVSTVNKLVKYASGMEGIEKDISQEGKVLFSDLEQGLYLLIQSKPAPGYTKVNPFLISLPEVVNDEYIFDIKAAPKVALLPEVTPIPPTPTPNPPESTPNPPESTPNPPESTPNPSEPTPSPKEPMLPQTGQLNWPIPLLTVLGIGLFIVGWLLRYGRKER